MTQPLVTILDDEPEIRAILTDALDEAGFRTMAFGDSYNDTAMLAEADQGALFCPPENVIAEFPQYPVAHDYAHLKELIQSFMNNS